MRRFARKKHMQFALVDNERIRPSSGLTALCPACGGAMIAKCGQQRVHHWAHRGARSCDPWWEPETPWHRDWKNAFHASCQEVILHAPSGEKHIADVRTGHGLTIEFQHSHLSPDERAAREQFYKDMMWVVDGARLKRDLPRFIAGFRGFRTLLHKGLFITPTPQEAFPPPAGSIAKRPSSLISKTPLALTKRQSTHAGCFGACFRAVPSDMPSCCRYREKTSFFGHKARHIRSSLKGS